GTTPSLYLAFANNFRTRLDLFVNGNKVNSSPIYPVNASDAMIRLGSHGLYSDMRIAIPANFFVKGNNKIVLVQSGGEVEFDYLRLEADIPNVIITKSGPTTFCDGGSVTITPSAGKSYRWFNGNTVLGITTRSFVATSSGIYKVEVTNTNGTKDTSDIIPVVENPLPVIVPYLKINAGAWRGSTSANVCAGGSIYFGPAPTNASGWVWSGPNNFSSNVRNLTLLNAQVTQSGIYTATYTDANGCSANVDFNVTINALPKATISVNGPTTFCAGGSVTLSASTASSYVWQRNFTTVGTGALFQAKVAGDYTVIVTNPAGCKDTSAATVVTVNPLPIATISASGATVFCQGNSITLSANPSSTYSWTRNGTVVGTSKSLLVNSSGNYVVSITDANGCSDSSPVTSVSVLGINQPSVTIASSATTVCSGTGVTFTATGVNGGTAPIFTWFRNNTQIGTGTSISVIASNGDQITARFAAGGTLPVCLSPATDVSNVINLTVNPIPVPNVTIVSSATTVCSGTGVTFKATGINGGTSPSYAWFRNNVQVGTGSTISITPSNGDQISARLTAGGILPACLSPTTDVSNVINLTVNPIQTSNVTITSSTTIVCSGTGVTFTATGINGGTAPTFEWFRNNVQVGTGSTISITPSNGDQITARLTAGGTLPACLSPTTDVSNVINLTVNPIPNPNVTIASSATTVCSGTGVTFTATGVNGGTAPSYAWFRNNVQIG
ncbi:MAG: hypothetical protein K2Q22_13225, partial [Cytophagales bacterium]|nr:hypothetical protein [Cytophagales bacterium]